MTRTVICLFALCLAACGPAPAQRAVSYGGGSSPSEPSGEGAAPTAAPAPQAHESAPAAGAESDSSASRSAPRDEERPGLGTVWGENRTSQVTQVSFVRASYAPSALMSINYNDEAGVRAQMAFRGGEEILPMEAEVPRGGVFVALKDDSGDILRGRSAGGRTYVVGQAGERYSVFVRNETAWRIEVVASVDGLDVIDGRPASTSKRGYIVGPHATLTIDGFRRSDETVAAFRFGRVQESYAARTVGSRNVGVIGVAFFEEQGAGWTQQELQRRETADPFPADPRYAQPPK